ncbi:Uncharacterised protein [Mycobacteroides abscessus subsp. abscessus]|nr:Uncharacterised protein [Mycobacteroides abscessus subsp. abscessus]
MADVLRPYLNISVVPLSSIIDTSAEDEPSLLKLAVDKPRPVRSLRGLKEADQAEVVEMYSRGSPWLRLPANGA